MSEGAVVNPGRTRASVQLRAMTAPDLAEAYRLSWQAKWPHRLEDWELMFRIGLGVVAESDGVVVGTAMAWLYGPQAATLGMVIVAPEVRGGGVGRQLMDAVMQRLGDRTVLLNATEIGLPLYKSMGFKVIGGVHQHQGTAFSPPIAALRPGERVRPMGSADHDAVVALDGKATGLSRGDLYAELRQTAHSVILDRDNEAVGFALFRRFGLGYAIGPTIAPDARGAMALISHWLGSNAGKFTRLDVPYESGLTDWLEGLGLACVGRVTTMAKGPAPRGDGSVSTFAILSQALG